MHDYDALILEIMAGDFIYLEDYTNAFILDRL